jgi:hypothetical protein
VPDVYVRDSEAERERCTERDRETRQLFVRAISEEQHVGLIDPDQVRLHFSLARHDDASIGARQQGASTRDDWFEIK